MFECIDDITEYAKEEFARFGISDWEFRWNNRTTRTLGCAFLLHKRIELSMKFVLANWDKPRRIRDVILHEIAHALAWIHTGHYEHGKEWVYYCNITGAQPNRYQTGIINPGKSKLVINSNLYNLIYA